RAARACVSFAHDSATTPLSTLSLHDALPISSLGEDGDALGHGATPGRWGRTGCHPCRSATVKRHAARVNASLPAALLQAGDGPPSRPRSTASIRPARRPALPPQVPAPVPGRIPRRDLPGLGTRLQMGDAPALATSAAARGLRGTVAERRLRRSCGPCSARRAALAPRHAVLVREDGVARRPARARRRADL